MARIPSKVEILDWISQNPTQTSKRDIARAFGIKGADRIDLKRVLKELEADGHLEKRKKTYRDPDSLPPVSVLRILEPDADGDQFAHPLEWQGDGPEPRILFLARTGDPALAAGDRILARLTKVQNDDHAYEARLIRRIGTGPRKILGIYRSASDGGRLVPIDKGTDREWRVPPGAAHGAKDGELVEAEQAGPRNRLGLPSARVTTRLGDPTAARSVSLIAIHQHGISDAFPDDALEEAEAATAAGLEGREDLRRVPLITIDPPDARDHDDAVFAEPDSDPKNPGGHVLWVAIADVAHYVTSGSALDRAARKRGNSTYFPDRVVPMLPDRLSGDLCSLREGEDRACVAVRMVLDADGNKISHRFLRGLMRSHARLSYAEAQSAIDGQTNGKTEGLLEPILKPLFAVYEALHAARDRRQPLDLDLPERRIELDPQGRVTSVAFQDRFDAHRLIEECMVLANVAAAETLIRKRTPLLFRVHEEPPPEKLDALRETAKSSGLILAKGQVLQTRHLNKMLHDAAGSEFSELINLSTLRSMTQAYYSAENFGHFGLALKSYAHFTSPIRRYADLVVHRALITAHRWGEDGLSDGDIELLDDTARQISEAERRSMSAERETVDRYLASYLADRVGAEFSGRVSGIARFGVFAKLDGSGADGLIPIRSIGAEFFHYDANEQTLTGADSGMVLRLGQRVTVRLAEAEPVTGGLLLELLSVGDATLPSAPRRAGGRKVVRRKTDRSRSKAGKLRKKLKRKRG